MSAPWTREKDERLLRLQAKGLSARQIADRLGTTRSAVIGRSARLRGVVFPSELRRPKRATTRPRKANPRADAALAALRRAIAKGLDRDKAIVSAVRARATYQAVGHELGLSRQRIHRIVAPVLGYRAP
jgi:hypothetical protein